MIFLVENARDGNKIKLETYTSLDDVAQRVEWQDILDPSIIIVDEEGILYAWDDSKSEEIGIVYNYTFKINGRDEALASKCKTMIRESKGSS